MKQFYLYLTIYSLVILLLSAFVYQRYAVKPLLTSINSKLDAVAKRLDDVEKKTIDVQLALDLMQAREKLTTPAPNLSASPSSVLGDTSALQNRLDAINQEIDQQLSSLDQKSSLTPAIPNQGSLGYLSISSPKWPVVDVYSQPSASSPSIGQLTQPTVYPYLQEQTGWYQVRLSASLTGWVQASLVKKVSQP